MWNLNPMFRRNPLIFGLFERMGIVEQVGSGINRIKTVMKKAELPEPVFKTQGMFSVILYRNPKKTRGKTREKMITLISENPAITTQELAQKTGITVKGVE